MSSTTDAAAAATVAVFNSLYTSNYCQLASAVLFVYDTFITFDWEVAHFWTANRFSGASILFFANKWISMTVNVMAFVELRPFPSDKAMVILQFVPGAVFSALRAYVLSGESKILGVLVAALSLAPVGANLVFYAYQFSGESLPSFGCVETDSTTAALVLKRTSASNLVIISRVPLIAADIILIFITWTRLRDYPALLDVRQSKRLTLLDVLFRGGTIYFVILFVLNILHLILSATAVAGDGIGGYSLITEFTGPIIAILISRFLLKLQETNHTVVKLDADDPLHLSRNAWESTPNFISSLGGFINSELAAEPGGGSGGVEPQDCSPSETTEEAVGGAEAEVLKVAVSFSTA
ncbi:hypothetical protein K466DRAFT_601779 [Polyporus arcularius HHB13444]|uniref:DUF6533 domain-containing protein n=1 Tax=Polyporus arcularius HHB13444 TaxID=1314778 RepID=A0A5C3PFN9_9APHY|nr:hypothetical protein K466DRAFT_601779 [Polyporus arcularius HHB13444]